MITDLARLRRRSSARTAATLNILPHSTRVLADISGPAQITHIWMAQAEHYRECLLKITYDDRPYPSVLVPIGDFFGLGHSLVNTYESALFSVSTNYPYAFNKPAALNCYIPMPFAHRAVIELANESDQVHTQAFAIESESLPQLSPDTGYFQAEFRRAHPFAGWGGEIVPNTPEANAANLERLAWENNYIILETSGRGHYIGCNLSVTNYTNNWWGEGDEMIWVDGYKWPPDVHGTGSEDYLGHAGGMHPSAFQHNGSSIFEGRTIPVPEIELWRGNSGYQTSYVFHLENPIHFSQQIKVTIEHGHANHLANEMSSTAYWYAAAPTAVINPPPAAQRMPVLRLNTGEWIKNPAAEYPGKPILVSDEMLMLKARAAKK